MSDRTRDKTHRHPADERTADQTTQSASGLSTGRRGSGRQAKEDVLNRNAPERYDTPRQYEENNSNDGGDDR